MNSQFQVWFFGLFLMMLLLDIKHLPGMRKSLKWFYATVYLVTFGIFLSTVMGYPPPMPTKYFIYRVSPWVSSIIHS